MLYKCFVFSGQLIAICPAQKVFDILTFLVCQREERLMGLQARDPYLTKVAGRSHVMY